MRLYLTVALAATLAALTLAAPAHAFTLGIADRATAPVEPGQALGAKTYRLVIDPNLPLANYDARIAAHRAVGQEPQIVVGGTGTTGHKSSRGLMSTLVAAAKRWPYVYSVGVVNEPDLSGMGVCEYARTFVQAQSSMRAMGVRRVLFGEFSPHAAQAWMRATMTRCGKTSATLRRTVRRVAWHGYDGALNFGRDLRQIGHEVGARPFALHMTEAGAEVLDTAAKTDRFGMTYWRQVFHAVKRDRIAQVVVWELHASVRESAWDSSLIDRDGRQRPAFHFIAARR